MRIAIIGNCHGGTIAQTVRAALSDVKALDCRHLVSYQDASAGDRDFVETADRVLSQVTDFRSRGDLLERGAWASGRVGLYPLLACNFIYPFAGKGHPLAFASRSRSCPGGYFEAQISDSKLLDMMDADPRAAASDIVGRYLALDYSDFLNLDRLYEINRLKMQRLGEAAGLDVWPKIERSFRDAPIFWTYLHPTGRLMRELCAHSLRQLRLGLDEAAIRAAVATVREPFGFAHMPIHPSVARHFAIDWAHEDYRYRFAPDGKFTIAEFTARFVRFEHDDELNRAVFNLHSGGDLAGAVASLERARLASPGSGDIAMNLAMGYWKQGRLPEAMEAAVSAVESDPAETEWTIFLCYLARQLGVAAPPRALAVPAGRVVEPV